MGILVALMDHPYTIGQSGNVVELLVEPLQIMVDVCDAAAFDDVDEEHSFGVEEGTEAIVPLKGLFDLPQGPLTSYSTSVLVFLSSSWLRYPATITRWVVLRSTSRICWICV